MTWRVKEGTYFAVSEFLNQNLFRDRTGFMAEIFLDLGNYYRYLNEYRGNGTATFYNFMWATHAVTEPDPYSYYRERNQSITFSYERYHMLHKFLNQKIEEIQLAKPECEDAQLVKDELYQTIILLKMIHKVNIAYNEEIKKSERIRYLEEAIAIRNQLLDEHQRLWLARNKSGGLQSSLTYLEKFVQFAEISLHCVKEVKKDEI
jgi:hypothetical protein